MIDSDTIDVVLFNPCTDLPYVTLSNELEDRPLQASTVVVEQGRDVSIRCRTTSSRLPKWYQIINGEEVAGKYLSLIKYSYIIYTLIFFTSTVPDYDRLFFDNFVNAMNSSDLESLTSSETPKLLKPNTTLERAMRLYS